MNVSRPRQILGPRVRIRRRQNRRSPVNRADPRRRPALVADRLAEWRAESRRIPRRNLPQVQRVAALFGERKADQPAAVLGHEVDGFGRHAVGCHRQIAFVFAVLVIHQDDHAPLANFFDGFFHRRKRRFMFCHLGWLSFILIHTARGWRGKATKWRCGSPMREDYLPPRSRRITSSSTRTATTTSSANMRRSLN